MVSNKHSMELFPTKKKIVATNVSTVDDEQMNLLRHESRTVREDVELLKIVNHTMKSSLSDLTNRNNNLERKFDELLKKIGAWLEENPTPPIERLSPSKETNQKVEETPKELHTIDEETL